MAGLVPICFTCARFQGLTPQGWSCEAFPAIPVDILSSTADHRRPFEGDGGLRYEERATPEVPAESRHDVADIFRRDAVEEESPVRAAGVMHVADDGRVLLMRRTDSGLWAFPGGHVEESETSEIAAAREVREETGYQVNADDLVPWTRRVADGVDFTTFIYRCGETFEPVLNHEHDDYSWEPWGNYSGEALARVAGRGGDEGSGGYSATGDALPPSHVAAHEGGARSDAWVEDEETGETERVGEVPARAERDAKLRLVEDAVKRLDGKVARAVRARRMDSVISRLRRRK